MMNNKHSFIAVVLGTLLAGCASDEQANIELEAPTNSQICCSSYSEFPYAQLNDNEDLKFEIDMTSPVAHFTTGNSHFAAFRFSDRSKDIRVTLSSLFIDDSIFAPQVILLDESFNVVRTIELSDFQTLPSDAFTRTRYITRFTIDASNEPYLIISTPADSLGDKIKVEHPAKVRAKEFGEVMPMAIDPVYTHQLGGTLELEVKTLKLRPFRTEQKTAEVGIKNNKGSTVAIKAQPETQHYYISAIQDAVKTGDIPKALSLLDEAKALNIEGAQKAFVTAVNQAK